MDERAKQRLSELLWSNRAKRVRKDIIERIDLLSKEIVFLSGEETENLAQVYWQTVSSCVELQGTFSAAIAPFTEAAGISGPAVYFHSETNGAGAMLVDISILLSSATELRNALGPDFCFMSIDGKYGLCFEVEEYSSVIRLWLPNG